VLLGELLAALAGQNAGPDFSLDVVVVDNDRNRSSEAIVRDFAARSAVPVTYDCEPERNISLTRNRAVRNATGNLIAFIDDDECPPSDWLGHLHRTFKAHDVQGVLGPVVPDFPAAAPAWLRKGGVFSRRRLQTGARIGEGDGRTGNVLLRRSIFTDGQCWFDPAFGRTGGEDSDFFSRQFKTGAVFVWCDEAEVSETVPPERWTVAFHLKRLLRAGTLDGEWMRAGKMPSEGLIVRNIAVFGACLVLGLPALLLPKHLRMRVWQKLAYSGGLLAAYCGISLLRNRD
jgi:cellulose synthase/poly-beta-1,6-N-acetylglucosamine synthase-like glycosyltransferase